MEYTSFCVRVAASAFRETIYRVRNQAISMPIRRMFGEVKIRI